VLSANEPKDPNDEDEATAVVAAGDKKKKPKTKGKPWHMYQVGHSATHRTHQMRH
jgi:hypothetical protein